MAVLAGIRRVFHIPGWSNWPTFPAITDDLKRLSKLAFENLLVFTAHSDYSAPMRGIVILIVLSIMLNSTFARSMAAMSPDMAMSTEMTIQNSAPAQAMQNSGVAAALVGKSLGPMSCMGMKSCCISMAVGCCGLLVGNLLGVGLVSTYSVAEFRYKPMFIGLTVPFSLLKPPRI